VWKTTHESVRQLLICASRSSSSSSESNSNSNSNKRMHILTSGGSDGISIMHIQNKYSSKRFQGV
jgi:hypothetical protein